MKVKANQLKYPDSKKHVEIVRTAIVRAIEFLEIAESNVCYARQAGEIEGRYNQELNDLQTDLKNLKIYIVNDLRRNEQ